MYEFYPHPMDYKTKDGNFDFSESLFIGINKSS